MFYGTLDLLGARDVISSPPPVYEYDFIKLESVARKIYEVMSDRKKIKLIGDYDADGAYAREVARETLDYLGYLNYTVAKFTNRTHFIDINAVLESYGDNTQVLIIMDTGSSEIEYLRRIVAQGIEVIIIDHHESEYGYDDYEGIHIINTTFERKSGGKFYKLSAAALTHLVFERVIQLFSRPPLLSIDVLALCSMYSDSIDMSTLYARKLYADAIEVPLGKFPALVSRFMTENTTFSRRFVEFNLTPPINALMRSENFELLNALLEWRPGLGYVGEIVEEIRSEHGRYSKEIQRLATRIKKESFGEFIVGNLKSVMNDTFIHYRLIVNYTGLIANRLAEAYNRPAVVYGDSGTEIKASVRDLRGRNFLSVFKTFSIANGHNSAFAVHMPYRGVRNFNNYVRLIDTSKYNADLNEPITLDYSLEDPSPDLIRDIAYYNEFAGSSLPFIYIAKVWRIKDGPSYKTEDRYYYKWAGMTVRSKTQLLLNTRIVMRPTRMRRKNGEWGTDLFVEVTV